VLFVVFIDKGGSDFRLLCRSTAKDTVGGMRRVGDRPLRCLTISTDLQRYFKRESAS
jgi:hypothetical protein